MIGRDVDVSLVRRCARVIFVAGLLLRSLAPGGPRPERAPVCWV